MSTVVFFVYGRPRPKGSPRAIARGRNGRPLAHPIVIHDSKPGQLWQRAVAATARTKCSVPAKGPVEVFLEFIFERPKSHWTGSGRLSSRAPTFPGHNCGDLDKLARNALDGLNAIAFDDDRQVVWLGARKRFHELGDDGVMERQGVHVRITEAA